VPGAVVLCLEIDEGNQHAAPIREKLIGYRRSLDGRPGWHALFIVPTAGRAAWLRRLGARIDPPSPATWVTTLDELHGRGTEARIVPVPGGSDGATTIGGPAGRPPRSALAPVGTIRWLELIGSGGSEAMA
jgi:hypothetical protein